MLHPCAAVHTLSALFHMCMLLTQPQCACHSLHLILGHFNFVEGP